MTKIHTPIRMDVAKPNATQTIHVMQGDIGGRYLDITLLNNGKKINISADKSAILNGITSKGEAFSQIGTINENDTITIPVADWMLIDNDTITCTISIRGQADEIITVFPFVIISHQTMSGHEITYTATADTLLKGKTAYINGKKITGTIETYSGATEISNNIILNTAKKYLLSNIIVNVSEGAEMEITTESILIKNLDVGTYKLTYNGAVLLYIDSSPSSNSVRLSGTGRILVVTYKTATTRDWIAFENSGGSPVIYYGTTTTYAGGTKKSLRLNDIVSASDLTASTTQIKNEMLVVKTETITGTFSFSSSKKMLERNPFKIVVKNAPYDEQTKTDYFGQYMVLRDSTGSEGIRVYYFDCSGNYCGIPLNSDLGDMSIIYYYLEPSNAEEDSQ